MAITIRLLAMLDYFSGSLFVLLLFAVIPVFYSSKNLPWFLLILAFPGTLFTASTPMLLDKHAGKRQYILRASSVLLLLIIPAIFSPIDFCIRTNVNPGLKVLPVIVQHGMFVKQRELESLGLVENEDFVVYYYHSFYNQVKWALVILLPFEDKWHPN